MFGTQSIDVSDNSSSLQVSTFLQGAIERDLYISVMEFIGNFQFPNKMSESNYKTVPKDCRFQYISSRFTN